MSEGSMRECYICWNWNVVAWLENKIYFFTEKQILFLYPKKRDYFYTEI